MARTRMFARQLAEVFPAKENGNEKEICARLPGQPPIAMPSISTRTGDDGTTGLLFGQRVPKSHPRIEAVGRRFDELNAALGLAKASDRTPRRSRSLEDIQRQLGAADGRTRHCRRRPGPLPRGPSGSARSSADALARLDAAVHRLENGDPPLKFDGWATPGRTPLAAALDLARVTARRARAATGGHARGGRRGAPARASIRQPRERPPLAARPAGGTIAAPRRVRVGAYTATPTSCRASAREREMPRVRTSC